MIARFIRTLGIASLLCTFVSAQFGLGKKKKGGTSFENLNEKAKQVQDGNDGLAGLGLGDLGNLDQLMGELGGMQEMWKDALGNPEVMEQLAGMGDAFGDALEELSKMSPQELEKQMKDAFAMLTEGDMADAIIQRKEEVLASLESSGMVSAEELAKFKQNPEYFEQQMRESFGQMSEIFSDPDIIKATAGAIHNSQNMMAEMTKAITEGLDSDEKIEEARLELLQNPELQALFGGEEMQDLLKDPKKFRDSVKQGSENLLKQGAGIGEL